METEAHRVSAAAGERFREGTAAGRLWPPTRLCLTREHQHEGECPGGPVPTLNA